MSPDSRELYVYTRELDGQRLLTICNFTKKEVAFQIPDEFDGGRILISNTDRTKIAKEIVLAAYEAVVVLCP